MSRIIERNTHDTSRLVKMAPRELRRKLQGKNFRPVYHHGLVVTPSHKSVIFALCIKDRRAARIWQARVNVARGCVEWGQELQVVAKRMDLAKMKARHEALKAAGTWIERNLKFGYE